jgi:hypothetical protein
MDGLITLFVALIALLILGLGALELGVDSRTYELPGELEFGR